MQNHCDNLKEILDCIIKDWDTPDFSAREHLVRHLDHPEMFDDLFLHRFEELPESCKDCRTRMLIEALLV